MTYSEQSRKILEGKWNDNISWEFYLGSTLPEGAICTSVSCLAITGTAQQIVLTRNRRGWEMLGGHIEAGESVEQTLIRESMEEGGYCPSRYDQYGFRRVSSKEPVPNTHHGGTYPPVTYIAHFIAETDKPLLEPTAPKDEIFERQIFTPQQIMDLHIVQEPFIAAGIQVYESLQAAGKSLSPVPH